MCLVAGKWFDEIFCSVMVRTRKQKKKAKWANALDILVDSRARGIAMHN